MTGKGRVAKSINNMTKCDIYYYQFIKNDFNEVKHNLIHAEVTNTKHVHFYRKPVVYNTTTND